MKITSITTANYNITTKITKQHPSLSLYHGNHPILLPPQCPLMEEPEPRYNDQHDLADSNLSSTPTKTCIGLTLVQPTQKKKHKGKLFRAFGSVLRSFPIITPVCKIPALPGGLSNVQHFNSRVTGTLFGYQKGRVSFSIQETSICLPSLVIELAMETNVLQKEMGSGMVRIALECEKHAEKHKVQLLDEPLWSMYCNGKKSGYGVKREACKEDLTVMELLKPVSMGAGVLPGDSEVEGPDGELSYIRASFDRAVGSKDSETFYMLSPEGNNGPELGIFFVRI